MAPRSPIVREAGPDDAAGLVALAATGAQLVGPRATPEALAERLALPPGEDHFVLLAELDSRPVGFVSGGGARDDDAKGSGELYELVVDPARADAVAPLLSAALAVLAGAGYDAALAWGAEPAHADAALAPLLPDGARRPGARRHRAGLGSASGKSMTAAPLAAPVAGSAKAAAVGENLP